MGKGISTVGGSAALSLQNLSKQHKSSIYKVQPFPDAGLRAIFSPAIHFSLLGMSH